MLIFADACYIAAAAFRYADADMPRRRCFSPRYFERRHAITLIAHT